LKIVAGNHEERMALPGMISLRVNMIVVAVVLIDFILKLYDIQQIKVSNFALKEGVLSRHLGMI
jgi:exopolyphosphatase/guanosine-5'-triphosphate,3'-diphosphate pyrophosphatase